MIPDVVLRAWRDDDQHAWESIAWAPETVEFLGEPGSPWLPKGDLVTATPEFVQVQAAICTPGDEVVGMVTLFGTPPEPADVTIAVRPDLLGKGYGTAGAIDAARLAFTVHPEVKISGLVRAGNDRSRKLVTALGLRLTASDDEDYLRIVPAGKVELLRGRLAHTLRVIATTKPEMQAWLAEADALLDRMR